jgi:VanZ family protein
VKTGNRRLEPRFAAITAAVATVILYGSLFPFRFQAQDRALQIFWASGMRGYTRMDGISNVLLYVPLGLFAMFSWRRGAEWLRVAFIAMAGAALSLAIELAQTYDRGRMAALGDFYANTAGTLLGATLAWMLSHRLRLRATRFIAPRPFVAQLLTSWLGYQLFSAATLGRSGDWSWLSFYQKFVIWLAVALLTEALVGVARSRWVFTCTVALLLLAQAAITATAWPGEQTWSGVSAVLLWVTILWRSEARAGVIATLFAGHVVVMSLLPFHFLTMPRAFGWVPFLSFVNSPRETAVRSMLDKLFTYGTLVWVLLRAGWPWRAAALAGSAFVLSLRLLQVYLPDRSAEITDCLMVLAMAFLVRLLRDDPQAPGLAQKR